MPSVRAETVGVSANDAHRWLYGNKSDQPVYRLYKDRVYGQTHMVMVFSAKGVPQIQLCRYSGSISGLKPYSVFE